MVMVHSYVSVEPAADADRAALVRAVESDPTFRYEADHGDELVFSGYRGIDRTRRLLASAPGVESATVLVETDEGPRVRARRFERREGDLVEVDAVEAATKRTAADVLALEHGGHGPV